MKTFFLVYKTTVVMYSVLLGTSDLAMAFWSLRMARRKGADIRNLMQLLRISGIWHPSLYLVHMCSVVFPNLLSQLQFRVRFFLCFLDLIGIMSQICPSKAAFFLFSPSCVR